MRPNFCLVVVWFLVLFAGCQSEQREAELTYTENKDLEKEVKSPHLVEPAEVYQWYVSGKPFKAIEITKPEQYEQGHLSNALSLWRPDYESSDYPFSGMRMAAKNFATLLGNHGITPNDFLLIYDGKGNVDASRFMWMLLLYGHKQLAIMNGGKVAWQQENYPLSMERPKLVDSTTYSFNTAPNERAYVAELEDVLLAIHDSNTVILDTREPEEYAGIPYIDDGVCYPYKKGAFTFGRIPGAVHLNWSDAVELKTDHRFKSLETLKYNFRKAGVTPDKKIIVYCQSGARSTHTAYVLRELLGYPSVLNYDGSWIEWSYYFTQEGKVPVERDLDEQQHKKQYIALQKAVNKIPF